MTPAPAWMRRRAPLLAAAGLAASLALLLWGMLGGGSALPLAGWLIGLVFWLGLALGAFLLLATHALTGGLWPATLRGVLAPATATLPLFMLLALPLLLDAGALFPWLDHPGLVKHEEVRRWYLNLPGLIARDGVALAGWCVLGVLLLRTGARRPAVGAAALLFHGVAITVLGVDWILSLEPSFRSTVFGAALSLTQVLSALAWCGLLEPEPAGGRGRAGDLAQMTIAAALGAIYMGFAQFLVAWYGNLPDKAEWFLKREAAPWIWLEAASVLLTAILPIAALLPRRMRRSPGAQAWIGAAILSGVALHTAWLIGPVFGPWTLASAALGLVAVGGIWLAVLGGLLAPRMAAWAHAPAAQAAAHGKGMPQHGT